MIRQAHTYLAGAVSGTALIAIAVAIFVMLVSVQAARDWPFAGLVGGDDASAPTVAPARPAAAEAAGSATGAAAAGRHAGRGRVVAVARRARTAHRVRRDRDGADRGRPGALRGRRPARRRPGRPRSRVAETARAVAAPAAAAEHRLGRRQASPKP